MVHDVFQVNLSQAEKDFALNLINRIYLKSLQ